MKKPNLLVIGASGAVATAFLHHLYNHRDIIGCLVLLDRNDRITKDPFINHKALDYTFIKKAIKLPEKEAEYGRLLDKHRIDIVLDLSTLDTIPLLEATDKFGRSLLNTAVNDEKMDIPRSVIEIYDRKKEFASKPHIMCSGMNPGIVNMWVRMGIEDHGIPKQLIHFEYDTAKIAKGWRPMMTWSVLEYLGEVVWDPSSAMVKGRIKDADVDSMFNREDMAPILKPIMRLDRYPYGFTVPHEECASVARKYGISSKYVYAVNMETMKYLRELYRKKGTVNIGDMMLGDNVRYPLDGSDSIGVILDYPDKQVYYFNVVSNTDTLGANATVTQVIVGVFAGLFTMVFDKLKPGVYFTEDLYDSHYRYFMTDNMRVQKYVFKKTRKGPKLVEYDPQIKLKRRNRFEHMYVF